MAAAARIRATASAHRQLLGHAPIRTHHLRTRPRAPADSGGVVVAVVTPPFLRVADP